jgi:hypothetical protein
MKFSTFGDVIVILMSLVGFVIIMSVIIIFRDRNFARRQKIRADNARAISRHRQWLADHPFYDKSHPEAQILLKKRINAYGLFCKEFHPIDGEERLKELISQLELTSV